MAKSCSPNVGSAAVNTVSIEAAIQEEEEHELDEKASDNNNNSNTSPSQSSPSKKKNSAKWAFWKGKKKDKLIGPKRAKTTNVSGIKSASPPQTRRTHTTKWR